MKILLTTAFIVSLLPLTALSDESSSGTATVCKSVSSDGQVSYGECAEMPSGNQQKIDIDLDRNIVPAEKTAEILSLEDEQRKRAEQKKTAEKPAPSALEQAKQALRDAEKAYEEGQKVQPGDFMGRADGGTRPSAQRLQRIEQLQQELEKAQQRVKALQ